jgi:hypothetical protein
MTPIPFMHDHVFVIIETRMILIPVMLVTFLFVPVLRIHRRDIERCHQSCRANRYTPSHFHRTSS